MQHSLSSWVENDAEAIREKSREIARGIRYQGYAVCRECGLPQERCPGWVRGRDGRFRLQQDWRCQDRERFAVQTMVGVMVEGPGRMAQVLAAWVEEEDGVTVEDMEDAREVAWWGQRIVWGKMESGQLVRMFLRCRVRLEEWQRGWQWREGEEEDERGLDGGSHG